MIDRWPDGQPAAVTLTFDGGYSASVDHALTELTDRRIPSTWFLVGGSVGGSLEGRPVAEWDTWRTTDPDVVEVGNHSFSHPRLRRGVAELTRRAVTSPGAIAHATRRGLTRRPGVADAPAVPSHGAVSARSARNDFEQGRDALEAGLERPIPAFAYPNGRATMSLKRAVRRLGHTSARTSRPGWNHPTRLDRFALRAQTWTVATTDADAQGWLDRSVSDRSWLIEVLHLVDEPAGYPWTTTPDQFRRHLDALAESGVWLATQSQVVGHLDGRARIGASR